MRDDRKVGVMGYVLVLGAIFGPVLFAGLVCLVVLLV